MFRREFKFRHLVCVCVCVCVGCQQNPGNDPAADLMHLGVNAVPYSKNLQVHTDYISNWDLTIVYNSAGLDSTAYLKYLGQRYYIFPLAWDIHNDTDGDPTEKEIYIPLEEGGMTAVFIDVLHLSISSLPVIAMHVIFENETQRLSIFKLDSDQLVPVEIFTLNSIGHISLKDKGRDNIEIRNDEPLAGGIRRIQYQYQGGNFIVGSPLIMDRKKAFKFGNIYNLSTKRDQINALKGPWVYSGKLAGSIFTPSNFDKEVVIANFMPSKETSQIIFSRRDMAEIFVWRNSSKLLNGLLLSLESLFESKIVQSAIIQFVTEDEIRIRFRGDMIWGGVYKRMSHDQRNESVAQKNMILEKDAYELSGTYSSGQGQEYIFSYPEIRIREEMKNKKFSEILGMYAIIRVNKQDILEIRVLDQNKRFKERRIFHFEGSDRTDSDQLVRSFRITRGELYTYGVETMGERAMVFEQISKMDK